jgi:basic membrane protein A
MAPYANMPEEAAAAAKAAEDGHQDRQDRDLQGTDQGSDRQLKVKDGESLKDDAIAGMNWLAEGIEGKLPS